LNESAQTIEEMLKKIVSSIVIGSIEQEKFTQARDALKDLEAIDKADANVHILKIKLLAMEHGRGKTNTKEEIVNCVYQM